MEQDQALPSIVLTRDWQDTVVFSANGPEPNILYEKDGMKVIVAGLEAGGRIPIHPEALSVYHFLTGEGWMTVDGERFAVRPGMIVAMPHGAARGLEADTRLAFLAVRQAPT